MTGTPMNPFDALEANANTDLGADATFRADADQRRAEVDRVIRRMGQPGRHRKAFQFAGEAVVIVDDKSSILRKIKGSSVISRAIPRQANYGLLCGVIEPISTWVKWNQRSQADREVPIPDWVTKMIVDIAGTGLPPLAGVADFPVLTDGGRLLHGRLGYDPESRLYVDCEPVDISNHSFESPQEALSFLIDDWLGEFHFKERDDAVRALAIPLTVMARRTLVHGGAPVPFVTAPSPETGKTLLAQTLVEVVTGAQLPATSWDHDNPEERRKLFMSLGTENPAAVLFDNIQNGWEVRCPVLERWITSDSLSDRVLGKQRTATVPSTSLLIYTGNNIAPGSTDLETRSYTIRMQKPKTRRKFKRADVIGWTAKNRSKIFAALMCIATAKVSPSWVPVSRFPSWAEHVGAKLQFAAGSKDVFRRWEDESAQQGSEELEELLLAMATKPGWNDDGFLPSEMSDLFTSHLAELEPHRTKEWIKPNGMKIDGAKVPPRQVWGLLRKHEGQLGGDYRLAIFEVEQGKHPRRTDRKVKVFKAVKAE